MKRSENNCKRPPKQEVSLVDFIKLFGRKIDSRKIKKLEKTLP